MELEISGTAIKVFAVFQLIHLMINLRQITNYLCEIKVTAKINHCHTKFIYFPA